MSFVNVGSKQGQCFTVNIFETGKPYIDVSLTSDLPPSSAENWLVGIESLSCPLDSTSFLDAKHPQLMKLRRIQHDTNHLHAFTAFRNSGAPTELDLNISIELEQWTEDAVTLRSDRKQMLEFGDLIDTIVQWTTKINHLINTVGLSTLDDPAQAGQPGFVTEDVFNDIWDIHQDDDAPGELREYRHLRVRLSPSGMLTISGSALFWNNLLEQAYKCILA